MVFSIICQRQSSKVNIIFMRIISVTFIHYFWVFSVLKVRTFVLPLFYVPVASLCYYKYIIFLLQYTTNTFQGVLITDGSSSYAVFIYDCDNMDWGGGVIGWQASTSQYNSHYLSGHSNSNGVGCLYSNTYSAVIFELYNGKYNVYVCKVH